MCIINSYYDHDELHCTGNIKVHVIRQSTGPSKNHVRNGQGNLYMHVTSSVIQEMLRATWYGGLHDLLRITSGLGKEICMCTPQVLVCGKCEGPRNMSGPGQKKDFYRTFE